MPLALARRARGLWRLRPPRDRWPGHRSQPRRRQPVEHRQRVVGYLGGWRRLHWPRSCCPATPAVRHGRALADRPQPAELRVSEGVVLVSAGES